ncbi:MAG: NAD-dependent epimerase/dehydratase family protein [Candidatus Hodarchaeales archaeon]|jgi:UDP-glucose 4-epimerase
MKILVTGGAGFVGSHLINDLLNQDHEIICLDNFSTGKMANIENVKDNITIIEGDIRELSILQSAIVNVDCVFHLAAQISVSHSIRDPSFDASINISGFINLLDVALNASVKRIVYVSTGGAIYGDPKVIPAKEIAQEDPISPYGISKLVGEKYLKWYNKTHGLSYAVIRPSNIYGPHQDPLGEAGVISIFLGRVFSQLPVEIFGNGSDTRDYIYVKDIADICIKAMNSDKNDTYNAGTGIETTLLELIDVVSKVTNRTVEKKFCPPRPGDVKKIALDSSKAKSELNWSPTTNLKEGIQHTWKWYKEIH